MNEALNPSPVAMAARVKQIVETNQVANTADALAGLFGIGDKNLTSTATWSRDYIQRYTKEQNDRMAAAVNYLIVTYDPAYSALVESYEFKQSWEAGDYRAAGEHLAGAGVHVTSLIMIGTSLGRSSSSDVSGVIQTDIEAESVGPTESPSSLTPGRSVSGELRAKPGPKPPPFGIDRRVSPTNIGAKGWPSDVVRIDRSIDPGRRPNIPAAAKRIIRASPKATPAEKPPYQFGHKPGHELWRDAREVRAGNIDRDAFLRRQQDPNIYHLENEKINLSHVREKQ